MTRLPSRILTAVPQHWPVRLEIVKAIRTLARQIEEEEQRKRRAELAAVRRDCDLIAEAIRELSRDLCKAGYNPNEPRVPAGNPDGGQWTTGASAAVLSDATPDNSWIPGAQYAANDPPGSNSNRKPPAIPQEKPATSQAVNTFLKAAAYFLAGAVLAGEPAGEFILALEAAGWLSQYLPLVYSYLDAPKTLEELQQAAQSPQAGYHVHHVVEQTPALQDGFPLSLINSPDNLVLVPALMHWQISAWFSTINPDFDYQSPRDYLRGKSWDERVRVGKDALIRFGVLQP